MESKTDPRGGVSLHLHAPKNAEGQASTQVHFRYRNSAPALRFGAELCVDRKASTAGKKQGEENSAVHHRQFAVALA